MMLIATSLLSFGGYVVSRRILKSGYIIIRSCWMVIFLLYLTCFYLPLCWWPSSKSRCIYLASMQWLRWVVASSADFK